MRPNYRLKRIQGCKVVTTHEKDKSKTFNVSRGINLTLILKAASTAKCSFSEKSHNAMIIGVVLAAITTLAVIAAIALLRVCKNKKGKTLFWLLLLIYGLFIY